MLPMTPAQSWAFLVLVAVAVLLIAWLIAEADDAIRARRAAAAEKAEPSEAAETRPALHLVEGSPEPSRGPSEVYDWAVQGI
ncbi:MAG: hypothetical protein Q4C81_04105 [Kocuria sp.]|nr:hypothetical protein [Kocuria sp.]